MDKQTRQVPGVSDNEGTPPWPACKALFDEDEQPAPRILIAEPRPDLRLQIGHALRHAGMHADFATSREDAWAMAERQRYDVAVLNPDLDERGDESLCRVLSRAHDRAPTPVIILSDCDSSASQVRARMHGARACLVHPLSSEYFVGLVWLMARGVLSHP